MADPGSIKELNILFNEFRGGLETRLTAIVDKFATTVAGLEDKFAVSLKGLEDRFDANFNGLKSTVTATADGVKDKVGTLQAIGLAVLGSIAVLIGGVGGNYFYTNQVKDQIIKEVGAAREEIAKLRQQVEDSTRVNDAFQKTALERLGATTVHPPPPPLTANSLLLVRQFIKTGPINNTAVPKYAIGDQLPEATLQSLPADLVGKAPEFSGVRYAIDPTSNLIALADTSGRVFALV
jgi:hypothetical protein